MTITDQMQFSVLTAPLAAVDRRTLSQAWYSALYSSNASAADVQKSGAPALPLAQAMPAHLSSTAAENAISSHATLHAQRATGKDSSLSAGGVTIERRAPRSALARKIERAFLQRRAARSNASFTFEGEHGRVHVVLQTSGQQLKLVAICAPTAQVQVAAALAQARYALAQRGITLEAHTRGAASC